MAQRSWVSIKMEYKTETYAGLKIRFQRDRDLVRAYVLPINKYDGKPKYFADGSSKKNAFASFKTKYPELATKSSSKMRLIAIDIEKFIRKYDLDTDVAIYFDGVRWMYDSSGKKKVEKAKASRYMDYANDKTLSMSYEGDFYDIMNGNENTWALEEEFSKLLAKHGYYYEKGNAWNLTIEEK